MGLMSATSTPVTNPGGPVDAGAGATLRSPADVRRRVKVVVLFALVAALLLWFALDIHDPTVSLLTGDRVTATDRGHAFNGRTVVWICLALTLVALAVGALDRLRGPWLVLVSFLVGTAFLVGFVIWNYADQTSGLGLVILNPLPGTVKYSVPLVFGALAGCVCERAGVINIAIEGQFLAGAFLATVVSSVAYSSSLGLLGGIAGGVAIAALLGVFALRYQVNQVVLGVVLIALATGLTDFLLDQVPDDPNVRQYFLTQLDFPPVPEANYPVLSPVGSTLAHIPVIGHLLFDQTLLAYLMYLAVAYVTFLLYQTRWGLRARAVGEHPRAADTVGIKVKRMRWQAVLLSGALAGLGGAYYTVGSGKVFQNDISAGNGFIALAAVIMGRWNPVLATMAALFFGLMSQLKDQLQGLDKIPSEFVGALPYVATIIAVAGLVGSVRPPAADGEPY
jgi:simple sugar transport system permease protein